MTNVVELKPGCVGDGAQILPETILESAKGALTRVVVVGYDAAGELYVASSDGRAESLVLLLQAQNFLVTRNTVRTFTE